MKNLSCEQNEPVRCVLRLFGASALGVQQAASAFPPEWCVTAQCRSRGAETLIALRSENAAGLDKARRSLHGCFAADLYGEGDTDLAAAVVQALEHRRRLLVCADAAAGALMEARLEAVPGAEKVFDFGTQSYADPKVGAQIARRAARRQDAAAALARVQAAQHLVGAELSAGCWEQDGKFLLLLGTRKGCWLRTVYREDGPGLWLLDMIRRAACGLPQVPGTSWQHYRDPVPEAVSAPPAAQAEARPAPPKKKRRWLRRVLLLLVALALAALAAGWVLSRLLSRPLQQLETAMEQFEQDADHFAFQAVRGTREVQNLSDSFGHMVGRIQQLMTTVREEEIVLRKTELKALQAQINPHFLYNTLDSIAWMCERGKNADAVQMVHALARLFRISISRGHELIPIEKELQHAEAYLQIQKYRYKNQFTYHFTVDESCLHCLCNKITLQPIIENAIVHGLDLMVDSGHIEITVKPDGDDILLIVADDGIGMEPEQVAALLQNEPSDRTGIGVKNVNDRLRIYFGADYGISIESAPYEGTTVTIRTPRVPEDREGDYDKNH